MDAKWTPEPWYIQIDSRGYEGVRNKGGFIAFSPSVSTFCDPVRFLEEREEVKANAERIVACVNALAGIENPAEYIAAFRAATLKEAANRAVKWAHEQGTVQRGREVVIELDPETFADSPRAAIEGETK